MTYEHELEMKAWDDADLLDAAESSSALEKAGPTGGPPRRGMIWRPSTHRWVNPPQPAQLRGHHLDHHARKLEELARLARRHISQAGSPESKRSAEQAHDNLRAHRGRVHREIAQRSDRGAAFARSGAVLASLARLAKEADEPFAVATATAQDMGFTDFSEGSEGREKRDEVAEALKMFKGLAEIADQTACG